MKGITAVISVILLILIVAAMASGVFFLFSSYLGYRVSKTISSFGNYCSFNSASIMINNDGKDVIDLVPPAAAEFETIGNMVPNPGFEEDWDGNGHADGWGDVDEESLDESNKVYGNVAMLLLSAAAPPYVTSDLFKIMHDDVDYDLSFYSSINITMGEFKALIYFYDETGLINITDAGGFTTSHTQFRLDSFRVHIPAGAKKAALEFMFNESGLLDKIYIDDVYFGPPVLCQPEGEGWRCGDLLVQKMSYNGEMYPYFKSNPANPGKSVVFKDGNCKGYCKYKLISPTNIVDVNLVC